MSSRLRILFATLLVAGLGFVGPMLATPANATTTLVGTDTTATGVDDLSVNGTLYDVNFVLGIPSTVFLTYTPIFNNATNAQAAALALINVLNTFGVTGLTPAENPYFMEVPYSTVSPTTGNYQSVEFSYNVFTPNVWGENSPCCEFQSLPGNTDFGHNFIAEFTPVATPLPAALPLFAGGLGLIGVIGHRKRKAQRVAAQDAHNTAAVRPPQLATPSPSCS
jgi:hypothetical protein